MVSSKTGKSLNMGGHKLPPSNAKGTPKPYGVQKS